MNETLKEIMKFINENTYLLIGICVFLILVLIGYLIDNSVKSKRVRNDIKNKDQVPENIKNDIIKEANEREEAKSENNKMEQTIKDDKIVEKEINSESKISEDMNAPLNFDNSESKISEDMNAPLNFDNSESKISEDMNAPLNFDNSESKISEDMNAPLSLDTDDLFNDDSNKKLNFDSIDILNKEDDKINEDPDTNIMSLNNKYSNDKSLIEILSDVDKSRLNDTTLFNNDDNMTIDSNVSNDVEIETQKSDEDNELDNIMKKLSSLNTSDDQDNYTNIF